MYRVLLYLPSDNSTDGFDNNTQWIGWFDASYSRNEVPFRILYNKEPLYFTVNKKLIVDKDQYFIALPVDEIIRVEAYESGSYIFMKNREFWTTDKKIDSFEKELNNAMFFKVHADHLINVLYVEKYVKCDAFITLSDSEPIPVNENIDTSFLKLFDDKSMI